MSSTHTHTHTLPSSLTPLLLRTRMLGLALTLNGRGFGVFLLLFFRSFPPPHLPSFFQNKAQHNRRRSQTGVQGQITCRYCIDLKCRVRALAWRLSSALCTHYTVDFYPSVVVVSHCKRRETHTPNCAQLRVREHSVGLQEPGPHAKIAWMVRYCTVLREQHPQYNTIQYSTIQTLSNQID